MIGNQVYGGVSGKDNRARSADDASSPLILVFAMTRLLAACLLLVGCLARSAQADAIFFVDPPATYTPGDPLIIEVALPAITDLGAYEIGVRLSSPEGVAGIEYAYDGGATDAASTAYVFPSNANYLDATVTDSPSQQRLVASDLDLAGVDVVPGLNDRTVELVIATQPGFTGDLELSFDTDGLILDTATNPGTAVDKYSNIVAATVSLGSLIIGSVPEPSVLALVLQVGLLAAHVRRVKIS